MAKKYSLKKLLEQAQKVLTENKFEIKNGVLSISGSIDMDPENSTTNGFDVRYSNDPNYNLHESERIAIYAYGRTPDILLKRFSDKILDFQGVEIPKEKSETFDVEIELS